jgi:hypothetical protein
MVEKPKHVEAGIDPFTYARNEKKIEKEKQNLREVKNKVLAESMNKKGSNNDRILGHTSSADKTADKTTDKTGDKTADKTGDKQVEKPKGVDMK